jgi:ribosomal protein S18 acetylase RimI-like enzyme
MTSTDSPTIRYQRLSGDEAGALLDELSPVFAEVYSEPPYLMGDEELALFRDRFQTQRNQQGFSLVTARAGAGLIGFVFGVTLLPTTTWWSRLLSPLPPDLTAEWPGRTFAMIELVVLAPWRRRGIARTMHDILLSDRTEERATLTARPEAAAAQAAYASWGWQKVGHKTNPLPGNPLYDILVKPLP